MSQTETLVADVIDALLATWRADATLLTYSTRLRIFDGPPITDRAAEIEIWVGATGLEADEEVIVLEQSRADFDGDRDETSTIANAIWVANGNNDIAAARRLAITVFAACAAAIRTSTLGVAGAFSLDISEARLRQGQFQSGVGCVLTFNVTATGTL